MIHERTIVICSNRWADNDLSAYIFVEVRPLIYYWSWQYQIEVKLRSFEGPVVGLPVLVNTMSKVNLFNIKCQSAVSSEGMHTFCFIYHRCSRIKKALRIQPTGWDMIKPRLWLHYYEAPALALRSRQSAGLIRGEDAIVPCLIIPQRASGPSTRFLFRQRGCFLAENWETLLCPFRWMEMIFLWVGPDISF